MKKRMRLGSGIFASLVNARAIASALSGLCRPDDLMASLDSSCNCPRALYLYVRDANCEINSGSLGIEISPSAKRCRNPSNTSARRFRYFSVFEGLLEPFSPTRVESFVGFEIVEDTCPYSDFVDDYVFDFVTKGSGNDGTSGVDDI